MFSTIPMSKKEMLSRAVGLGGDAKLSMLLDDKPRVWEKFQGKVLRKLLERRMQNWNARVHVCRCDNESGRGMECCCFNWMLLCSRLGWHVTDIGRLYPTGTNDDTTTTIHTVLDSEPKCWKFQVHDNREVHNSGHYIFKSQCRSRHDANDSFKKTTSADWMVLSWTAVLEDQNSKLWSREHCCKPERLSSRSHRWFASMIYIDDSHDCFTSIE